MSSHVATPYFSLHSQLLVGIRTFQQEVRGGLLDGFTNLPPVDLRHQEKSLSILRRNAFHAHTNDYNIHPSHSVFTACSRGYGAFQKPDIIIKKKQYIDEGLDRLLNPKTT